MLAKDGERIVWDLARVRRDFAQGPPASPLVLLACDAGDFTDDERTIAEEVLFLPGGPVAVIAATTESHPLTNYYSGQGLLRALSAGPARLGDAWLEAQRTAMKLREVFVEMALEEAEGKLDSKGS